MLQLIWGLLNITIFFYFIFVCVKGARLIRQGLGTLAAVVFVIGLFSFAAQSNGDDENKEPNSNMIKQWTFLPKDSLKNVERHSTEVTVEKTMVSTSHLNIQYVVDTKNNRIVSVSASSYMTGFISGTIWKPTVITLDTTAVNNKIRYAITGTVNWKLFGFTLYTENKDYAGTTSYIQYNTGY